MTTKYKMFPKWHHSKLIISLWTFTMVSLVMVTVYFQYRQLNQTRIVINHFHTFSQVQTLPIDDVTCHHLLDNGTYTNTTEGYSWKPMGNCTMHYYNDKDAEVCLKQSKKNSGKRNWFVLFGDSRVRRMFEALVKVFDAKWIQANAHRDYNIENKDLGLKADFYWHPNITDQTKDKLTNYSKMPEKEQPTLIILGFALWSISTSKFKDEAFAEYKQNVAALLPALSTLRRTSLVLWREQYPIAESLRNRERQKSNFATNEVLDCYNEAASNILKDRVKIWRSSRRTGEERIKFFKDAYHSDYTQSATDAQILANLYCNKATKREKEYCCS